MKYKIWVLTLSMSALCACATKSVQFDSQKLQGRWDAKVQVKDLKHNESHNVSLEVIGVKPNQIRMEITASLGFNLASLVMKHEEISYILYQQKKFFSGPISDQALKPLFNIDLNPKYLLNVFFDQPILDKGWSCGADSQGLVEKCQYPKAGLEIEWKDRQGERKRVIVKSADFEVQVLVKDFSTKVELNDKTFSLDIPSGYKAYRFR